MNYIGSIVKILEIPKQKISKNGIYLTQLRAQFPESSTASIIILNFWGNVTYDFATYYKTNDYIIIEGYISIQNKQRILNLTEIIKITVLKVYPFLLAFNYLTVKGLKY